MLSKNVKFFEKAVFYLTLPFKMTFLKKCIITINQDKITYMQFMFKRCKRSIVQRNGGINNKPRSDTILNKLFQVVMRDSWQS